MQITTSWMRQGIEQGIERGIEQGIEQGIEREKTLIIRQLKRKLGEINPSLETKIMQLSIDDVEVLGEALFDFSTVEDLINWLENGFLKETRFLVINVNFCYRGLEKLALVELKLLAINFCCQCHDFYPVADYSCC